MSNDLSLGESRKERLQNDTQQHKKEWENNRQFHAKLLEISKEYTKKYKLIDNTTHVAPLACGGLVRKVGRTGLVNSKVLVSNSSDKNTHGKKLYLLFAAKKNYYDHAKKHTSPVGQAIVKESWEAVEAVNSMPHVDALKNTITKHSSGKHVSMYASKGGKSYHAGKQKELFIMYKLSPQTKGTDKGWVYGTVTANGKTVTGSGRLQNCMKCHKKAGVDRLFGPKNVPRREFRTPFPTPY